MVSRAVIRTSITAPGRSWSPLKCFVAFAAGRSRILSVPTAVYSMNATQLLVIRAVFVRYGASEPSQFSSTPF